MARLVFEPYSQAFAADPYPVYARLREQSPVFYAEACGMTCFAKYADVSRLLADRRLGRMLDGVAPRAPGRRVLANFDRYVRTNMLEREGAAHARHRRILSRVLTPALIRNLQPRIETLVDELLAAVAGRGQMEFLEQVAVPLPVYVISELIGWPAAQRHRLRPWSADIVRLYEKDANSEEEARAEAAATEFSHMLRELIERRRIEPADDLISALSVTGDEEGGLSDDELVATAMLLLNAGHEATVNAAGNGLLALLRHPAQLRRLRDEPSLVADAVEEMLRYDAPLHFFHRFVLEDLEYAGHEFKRGDMVGYLYGSANRDPEAFAHADEFDIGRRPNPHLAFGKGAHFCMGAPLARLELQILFAKLIERLPKLRLVDERPGYHTGLIFRGLKELKVQW